MVIGKQWGLKRIEAEECGKQNKKVLGKYKASRGGVAKGNGKRKRRRDKNGNKEIEKEKRKEVRKSEHKH